MIEIPENISLTSLNQDLVKHINRSAVVNLDL